MSQPLLTKAILKGLLNEDKERIVRQQNLCVEAVRTAAVGVVSSIDAPVRGAYASAQLLHSRYIGLRDSDAALRARYASLRTLLDGFNESLCQMVEAQGQMGQIREDVGRIEVLMKQILAARADCASPEAAAAAVAGAGAGVGGGAAGEAGETPVVVGATADNSDVEANFEAQEGTENGLTPFNSDPEHFLAVSEEAEGQSSLESNNNDE